MKATFSNIKFINDGQVVGVADGFSVNCFKNGEVDFHFPKIVFYKKLYEEFDVQVEVWSVEMKTLYNPFRSIVKKIPNTKNEYFYKNCFLVKPTSMYLIFNENFILENVEVKCLGEVAPKERA